MSATPTAEPTVEDMSLDVWLRIPPCEHAQNEPCTDECEIAEAEANTYITTQRLFRVDWSLTAVGLISSPPPFVNYAQACAWLTAQGFDDYSS